MPNTPNKSEQVAETDMNKSENDCRQDVCYGDTLPTVDDEKVVSGIGVYNGVQQSPLGSKEMCTLDTTPVFLPPSPSSTTNVALLPLSSIPVTDGITSSENGESAAVSSSSMPDAWLLPPASPVSELIEERKNITPLASPSILQIPEKYSFDATLEGLPCSPDSGTLHALPMATCNPGLRSCLGTPPSVEADLTVLGDTTKDAELPVTPLTTCVELITPTQQTVATVASSVSYSAYMSTLSTVVDQCSPCDRMPDSHPGSTVDEREAFEPVLLCPGLDVLTPIPLSNTLAGNLNSSPSLRGQHSDSTSQTTPPSSPRTEYDTANANGEAGERTANVASETYDFPTRIMSSPGPSFRWGDMQSSSPPQQRTSGAKRPACDSGDEDWTSGKPVKRMKMGEAMSSPPSAPAPRRATLASQKLSRKKLAAPFRSPLAVKSTTVKIVTPVSWGEVPREQVVKEPQTKCKAEPNPVCLIAQKTLVRSSRAAAQFRSPLVKTIEHGTRPLVLPSQATMALERKLTFLRRAVKIKRDGDESHLERLAVKWRDAAREAAYELWSIVRDLSTEEGEVRSNSSDAGWGWEERNGHGTVGNDAEDEERGAQKENTLGVMLRKLGIAPETLGWNDEEETFVDGDDVCE
ncbi:hypothetical protein EDB86DRAFT_42522 [Lactarius hatsudake]|nr:hypothetical protein EDB86DRAFT_42522 [Lactarius hatsudake]